MEPFTMAGMALGVAGGIGKLLGGRRANKKMEELMRNNPRYQANPLANERLALAQQLLNARMPGASALERNIYTNQANTLGNVQRNATTGSEALAVAAGVQGTTNQAFQDLQLQEAQDYQRRYGNVAQAQEGVIEEGDKVYQDQVRRFQDLAAIRGAQIQNTANAWEGVSNLGFGMANYGLSGGFNNLFNNVGSIRNSNLKASMPRGSSMTAPYYSGVQIPVG